MFLKFTRHIFFDRLEPTPSERPRQPSGLVRGVMCKLNGFAKKVGMCICSEGIDCFVSFIVVPLFVYWCVFLSVSPTQENTFAHVFSPFGKARVFCGAALPYDLNSLNPLVVAGVPTFCIINFLLNRLIPFGRRSIVVGGCRAEHKANGKHFFSRPPNLHHVCFIIMWHLSHRFAGVFAHWTHTGRLQHQRPWIPWPHFDGPFHLSSAFNSNRILVDSLRNVSSCLLAL